MYQTLRIDFLHHLLLALDFWIRFDRGIHQILHPIHHQAAKMSQVAFMGSIIGINATLLLIHIDVNYIVGWKTVVHQRLQRSNCSGALFAFPCAFHGYYAVTCFVQFYKQMLEKRKLRRKGKKKWSNQLSHYFEKLILLI